jgi:hypothetical protein
LIAVELSLNENGSEPHVAVFIWAFTEESALFLLKGDEALGVLIDYEFSERVLWSLLYFMGWTVFPYGSSWESIIKFGAVKIYFF